MKHFYIVLLILLSKPSFSQTVLERYDQFGGAATYGQEATAFSLAEKILPEVSSLTERQQAIFYYKLAGLHEGKQHQKEAVDFYQRSLKLEPDFYVPHLALGYLYLGFVNESARQLNAEKKDMVMHTKYKNQYYAHLKKALTHLEKAMACDPNEEALKIIKNGYQTLKDPASLSSLDERVKELARSCKSVLVEE
jgi:tetratricopeptide (TPR) repeat protein